MKSRKTKLALIAIVLFLLFGQRWMTDVYYSDVSFESSDGSWGDSEMIWKGRDYKSIRLRFERCLEHGIAPGSYLVRTTRPDPIVNYVWPSFYSAEKWQVPYRAARRINTGGFCPDNPTGNAVRITISSCLTDCNTNGIPDCKEGGDCNANGILDLCDLSTGTSQDQNGDAIPDECSS